jgi:hypothetical protein
VEAVGLSILLQVVLPLDMSLLQHPVLPLEMSLLQHPVLPLDMSVIQKCLSQSAGCLEQCPRRDKAGKDCPGFSEGLQSPPEERGGHLMTQAMTMEFDDEDDETR